MEESGLGRLTPGAPQAMIPARQDRLGGRCYLSRAWRRAHPARHRSPPLRARSHPDRAEPAPAHLGDHAFTVAHSITLAAATLGVVHVPPPPIEAAIAGFRSPLSPPRSSAPARARQASPARAPWVVALCLRAPARLRLRRSAQRDRPARRVTFRSRSFSSISASKSVSSSSSPSCSPSPPLSGSRGAQLPRWAALAPPYLIGTLAMFWVIQRVSLF